MRLICTSNSVNLVDESANLTFARHVVIFDLIDEINCCHIFSGYYDVSWCVFVSLLIAVKYKCT